MRAFLAAGVLARVAGRGAPVQPGAGEWLLAIAWGGLALWQFRAWWFHRRSVAIAPLVAGPLLAVLAGWPG